MELTDNIKRLLHVKSVADSMSLEWHFPVLAKYVNERNYKIGVEIGVAFAGNSEYLLAHCPGVKHLIGVDPYIFKDEVFGLFNQSDCEDMYLIASDLHDKDNRFILLRETSNQFFLSNGIQYDFIFIDGDHSYEQATLDIKNFATLIRDGGMLCGHDYKNFPGVTQAVDEFAAANGKQVIEERGTMWVINL